MSPSAPLRPSKLIPLYLALCVAWSTVFIVSAWLGWYSYFGPGLRTISGYSALSLLLVLATLLTTLIAARVRAATGRIIPLLGSILSLCLTIGVTCWHHRPSENLLGNHDQGMYLAAGLHLQRTGAFRIELPELAGLSADEKAVLLKRRDVQFMRDAEQDRTMPLSFAIGFPLADQENAVGPAIPHFPAGFAVALASMAELGGRPLALAFPALAILGGTLALGLVVLRQFGLVPCLLFLPLCAAHPLLLWSANRHYSEPFLFLLFALLLSALCWIPRHPRLSSAAVGLLAAAALLVKIDALALLPGFVALGILARVPRPAIGSMAISSVIGGGAAAAFLTAQSGEYFAGNIVALYREPTFLAAGIAGTLGVIGLVWLVRRWPHQAPQGTWRAALVACGVAILWLVLVRTDPSQPDFYFNPAVAKSIRSFREDTLARLDWYWLPGGVAVAVVATICALWSRRSPALIFLAAVGLACLLLLGFDLRCDPLQPFCMRRLLPFTLPLLLVGLCGAWKAFRPPLLRGLVIVATLLVGSGEVVALRHLADSPEYPGLVGLLDQTAAAIPPDALVLFSERTPFAAFAAPLRAGWGVSTWIASVDKNDPGSIHSLRNLVLRWQQQGRTVCIVGTAAADPFRLDLPLLPIFDQRLRTTCPAGSYTDIVGPIRTIDWRVQISAVSALPDLTSSLPRESE